MNCAFIIPTLNCLDFTKQAVLSIPQGLNRIYLIDNGSTDGTGKWAREQEIPIDVTEFGENRGVAAAWNYGLRKAFGDGYTRALVMNNDIVLANDTLPALFEGLERYGGVVSAHSVAAMAAMYRVDRHRGYGLPVDYSCFMLKPETFEKVGPFDEAFWPAYFEDQDWDCRAEQMGVPRGYVGNAVVVHFVSQTIQTGQIPKHAEYFEKNRQLFLARWGDYIRGGRNARSL